MAAAFATLRDASAATNVVSPSVVVLQPQATTLAVAPQEPSGASTSASLGVTAGAVVALAGVSAALRRRVRGRKDRNKHKAAVVFGSKMDGKRQTTARRARGGDVEADDEVLVAKERIEITSEDPTAFTLGILGDLHLDPRDLDHSYEGQGHMKKLLAESPRPFLVSLGDLGESKDCTQTRQLFSGTTECFKLAGEFLGGFGAPFDVVGGNHDLEGIDEFPTDKANLEAYLQHLGKKTPQFAHQVAEKTLIVGLGSTVFRDAPYTSHEVFIDDEQIKWFEKLVEDHSAEDDWKLFVFSHAPIIGSSLRVLQECHVVNGCCWLNHNDGVSSKKFIEIVRNNPCIKGWFSGHFHLSHDYEDSITFPGGNNRGSCVFAQTGVMTARSSRDGRRQSRLVKGNSEGFEVYTVDHKKGGVLRLDATVTYSDVCEVDPEALDMDQPPSECSTLVFAHKHEDYDHDLWFSAYTPHEDDGCHVVDPRGKIVQPDGTEYDFSDLTQVCWWHMKDGAVLGVHNGMIIEYDPSTLAPLGMVVSRDELEDRSVAVIDDEWGGSALILYSDGSNEVTVVQPNEDGSYWRKVVRNKMHRMWEMRRMAAAKNWLKNRNGSDEEVSVLSSYGPYTTTAGQVMGLTTKAINPKAVAHKEKANAVA